MAQDFLLELRSEEIPARMQAKARNDLARLFAECTDSAGLKTGAIEAFSTPRRLVLIARGVADATEASREELKGPRSSAPPQALEGFLRKTGLTQNQLEERDGVYFAVVERAGRPATDVLAEAIRRIVADFPWPKSMRWGEGTMRWVRPLHSIVALLGEEIVPVSVEGVESGATTKGHRFHHPGPITIGSAADYVEKLRACHVIVDHEERERIVREGAEATASAAGLTLLPDEGLVVENAGLTEWPMPLLGRFDADYLDVPREVIVLTMRTNQKYFACSNDEGLLAPAFVCVANIDANDGGAAIVEGNRRVLAARLADARFFWEQDLKVPLEEQAKKLSGIVFHEKLGTVADKVERVAKLARWLVEEGIVKPSPLVGEAGGGREPNGSPTRNLSAADAAGPHPNPSPRGGGALELADQAERAARLAKADLVTGMVGEFPELQGVIGGYLAAAQGEPEAIAEAIRDHYKPVGQGDDVPASPVTVAVSLADKLDSLSQFFAVGLVPTGSKDPFALRRAALGVISLVLQNELKLSIVLSIFEGIMERVYAGKLKSIEAARSALIPSLKELVSYETGLELLDKIGIDQRSKIKEALGGAAVQSIEPIRAIRDFVLERMEVALRDSHRIDLIRAGSRYELTAIEDEPLRLVARVRALQSFLESDDGANLLTAYKRAANILKKENWSSPRVLSVPGTQGIPQTGEEDPLVLVDDPILGDAIAEIASGQAGADLPEEQALIAALNEAEPRASAAIEAEDFTAAMAALASLRQPIDVFFDKVTVNDADPSKRERRLNLLARFRDAVNAVADFSKIEG